MHGLYLLWWVQERHISPPVVAAILAAGELAVTVFEVPTGWLADRFGYRLSLIVGSAVQVAGILCCWLGRGVPGVLSACLLVALGDGFRSGADQALLYRSCASLGREADFQKIEATTRTVRLGATVGLVLLGGAIVEAWGFAAGWFAETCMCASGLFIAYAMVDPSPATDEGEPVACTPLNPAAPRARDYAWTLIVLTAPAAFLSGASSAATFWAKTDGGDAQRMTWLVAAITLAEAGGSMLAIRLPVLGIRTQAILSAFGAVIMGVLLVQPWMLVPVVFVLSFLLGLAQPLRAAAVQRLAGDDVRATASSIANACDKVFDTVALVFAGSRRS